MVTIGLNRIIRVRLSEQDYDQALAHVNNNPESYYSLSHFIRAAIIQKINSEVTHNETKIKNN